MTKNGGSVLAYCNQGAFANGATCNITYGTSAPTGSGKKGDIYIQNFVGGIMKTATFTGDLIPDSVAGYAHYWLKMVVTETSSTSTDISGTVALYFCRNAESGAGYQFDNGNSLSVQLCQ